MQADSFQALIRLAQAGDQRAMERLLADFRPHMEAIARKYADPARADESASDLVQEAGLRAWQRLGQFTGGPDDAQTFAMFRSWVDQIVRRLGLNARRDGNTQRRKDPHRAIVPLDAARPDDSTLPGGPQEPAASDKTPSSQLRTSELARTIHAAVENLPDETDREIVRLYFFEALPLAQIAPQLGLSYDKVKERYRAAVRKLEKDLGRYV